MTNINPRWQRFAEEYLIDFNLGAAYVRAGYKSRGHAADVNASTLFKKPEIQALVQAAQKVASKKTLVSVEFVVEGLREVAQRCLQRTPVMIGSGKDRRQAKAMVEDPETGDLVEVGVWEFDSSGANRSLELLGKHVGAFVNEDAEELPMIQRVEIVVKNGGKAD